MTKLRDILNDLIIEIEDLTLADGQKRTDKEREEFVDQTIEQIKERLID